MIRRSGTASGQDLVLCIGGLVGHVELRGGTQPFLDQVLARYAAFEMPAVPPTRYDFSLRLELRSAPPPGARDVLAEAEAHPLKVTATEAMVGITRWDSVCASSRMDAGGGEATGAGDAAT